MPRKKKSVENQNIIAQDGLGKEIKKSRKKSYRVVLVGKNYLVIDYNGNTRKIKNIWGDIKRGDEVSLE